MAELVLGILGVVPLVGVAIKSYQSLGTKLKTFRHCSSTVQRVYKKLKIQRRIFENECELMLRDCLDDEAAVQEMMADPDHEYWRDKGRDDSMRGLLKQNYDGCAELIGEILEAISKLESRLECFQAVKSEQQKGERIKDTWKRLGDGLRISVNKGDYESGLDDLRTANTDLRGLREQLSQLRNPCKAVTNKRPAMSLSGWTEIRRASKALHEALVGAWSCSQASHLQHFVKLFLEAEKTDDDVHLDIAIMCHGYGRAFGHAKLIQLQVRSRHMDWMSIPRLLGPSSSPATERPRKRMKAVRFSKECSKPHCAPEPSLAGCTTKLPTDTSSDLTCTKDFCSELAARCIEKEASFAARCLGHIDVQSEDNFRHLFYSSTASLRRGICPSVMETGNLMPMDTVLCEAGGSALSTVDKLKMARSLVVAVLKFHKTPWLGEAWRLQDLSFFHRGQDLSQSLRTLHLGIEFVQETHRQIGLGPTMEGLQMAQPSSRGLSQASEDERLFCGIENMTLHSLGVALLQIDRLKRMEPDDVLGVRKMARLSSTLGPRYREITQQCLRCDFGYGTDLDKIQLQKAVYESVVGALETMISSLDIADDEE